MRNHVNLFALFQEVLGNFSSMADTAETANKIIVRINSVAPGFAACGVAGMMGCPAVPVLIATAMVALGVVQQVKQARDEKEKEAIMRRLVQQVEQPYNTARRLAKARGWAELPAFVQEPDNWMLLVDHLVQEEGAKTREHTDKSNQQFWNWFADYIKPRMTSLESAVRAIDRVPLYVPEPIANNDYYYAGDENELVGRATEQGYLDRFLESDDGVAWMLMIGGAGSGKSRLGLWAVQQAQDLGFDAGFLNPGTQFENWDKFIIHDDTLVVVDYALRRQGNLQMAFSALAAKRNNRRLRFLVLERAPVGLWYSGLQAVPGKFDPRPRPETGQAEGDFPYVDLGTMARPGVVELFSALTEKGGMPSGWSAEGLADRLLEADPKGRPLFARFLLSAVQAGKDTKNWKAQDLAQYVLDHEISQRWMPANVDTPHANLATVACALRGVRTSVVDGVACLKEFVPSKRNPKLCHVIGSLGGGFDSREGILPAHEPDTIAELYVLERLVGKADCDGAEGQADETKEILDCLWLRQESQAGMVDLLQRAARNFPAHEGLDGLKALPSDVPEEVRAQALGQVFAAQTAAATTTQDLTMAFEALARAGSDDVPNASLLILQAQALYALTFYTENAGAGAGAGAAALGELRKLAAENPTLAEVRELLGHALVNAAYKSTTGVEAKGYADEIGQLHAEHGAEPEVRLEWAEALTNAAGKATTGVEAKGYADEIGRLHSEHGAEPEVRLRWAKALMNATVKATTGVEAKGYADEIGQLHAEYGQEPEVWLEWAKALYNATVKATTGVEAKGYADEIGQLHSEHGAEPEVRLTWAKALNNATVKATAGVEAKGYADEIGQLHAEYGQEPEVRLEWAMALMNAAGKATTGVEARGYADEIGQLHTDYGQEPEVRLEWARALTNAAHKASTGVEAKGYADEIGQMHAEYGQEPEVRLEWAMALLNAAGKATTGVEARGYADESGRLHAEYGQEPEVRLVWARAQTIAALKFLGADDRPRFLDEMRTAWNTANPPPVEVVNMIERMRQDGVLSRDDIDFIRTPPAS